VRNAEFRPTQLLKQLWTRDHDGENEKRKHNPERQQSLAQFPHNSSSNFLEHNPEGFKLQCWKKGFENTSIYGMAGSLEPRYDSKELEEKIYKTWEDSGYFNPDNCIKDGVADESKPPYSIVLPPPNVTGILHVGHAAMLAIEDILIRFARMQGRPTLWVPGTDHAAIATQSKVESEIYKKEDKNRHDLGKEEFLRRVNEFAKESRDSIVKQIKSMGASLDWSREAYTLDEKRSLAVRTAFKKMYDAGLIYRGYKVVNWDPKGQTVISDDEIIYEERDAKLYTFKYSKDFPIAISTTRPETKFGDTAVAVHPDDTRYQKYIGQEFHIQNFAGVPLDIKVISDAGVEKDFGTGALGVTPAHSMVDWEMAQKNSLPLKQVIDERGKMMLEGELNGKKVLEVREAVVEWLKSEGLLEKEENIKQNISLAERTGAAVEPLPKLQWFVDVNKKFLPENSKISGISPEKEISLKELMRHVVEQKLIQIVPEHFEKTYFNWIDNLRDWCISRQIWFGHQIPVWYKSEEIYVGVEAPKEGGWEQDSDTLDTWFSSGLWTFSTLGWPEETRDLEFFHPTSVLETGYDILFFWVARMILMTGVLLGDIPFHKVYLHGLVRDDKGKKMSKSLGNAIDPLEMSEKYGADATRLSLIIGAAPGNDIKLSEDRIRGYRNFTTKIWNAARFVLMNKPDGENFASPAEDKPLLEQVTELKKEVTAHIENFEFHLAGEKLYHYFWHTFADEIIESMKPRLKNPETAGGAYATLETILLESLKMLHPFMPYITEELYSKFKPGKLLMVERW
jgi:valyl-tRNA synthetase